MRDPQFREFCYNGFVLENTSDVCLDLLVLLDESFVVVAKAACSDSPMQTAPGFFLPGIGLQDFFGFFLMLLQPVRLQPVRLQLVRLTVRMQPVSLLPAYPRRVVYYERLLLAFLPPLS